MQTRFALVIFVVFPFFSLGQTTSAELWNEVSLGFTPIKDFSAAIKQNIRFEDNMTSIGSVFTDVEIGYKLSKRLKVSGTYRLKETSRESRYNADVEYSPKTKRIKFDFRIRYQRSFELSEVPDNYFRGKFEVSYDRKKYDFKPFIATEWFYNQNYRYSQFDAYRIQAGSQFDLSKDLQLSTFYLLENEFNVRAPKRAHIWGLGLKYDFGKLY